MRKTALEGEISRLKLSNNNLLKKVKEIQQHMDLLMEKVTTIDTVPTPMPFTRVKEKLEKEVQCLQEELTGIKQERDELRDLCDEFRSESESILSDYSVCAQRLKTSQEEIARWTSQHKIAMMKLDWQKERTSILEEQRGELEKKLSCMDLQVG